MKKLRQAKILSQTQYIASGFMIIILIGTFLLMMPFSSRNGGFTDFVSALFTATSATCVTGLVVADTYQKWSSLGQLIILCMIQIGGLGFITIGVFFSIYMRKNIGLRERGRLQESVNTIEIGGIVRLVKKIIKGTILFEGIGALILAIRFMKEMDFLQALYFGIFHAISAFCNAGFDLMGKYEEYSSLTAYRDDIVVNVVIMLLIIIGGLGFIVWDDISRNGIRFKKYQLHTKIVVMSTMIFVFGGAILFYLFEQNHLLAGVSPTGKILASLFSAVTPRTAGFNTIDTASLDASSRLLTIILMFIGGSPGSTAGGIKTTTIFVMFLFVWANLHHGNGCEAFGRRLPDAVIRKASTVFITNLSLAIISSMIMCSIQAISMDDALFETFSAIGTVGMSTGVTRQLTVASRLIIILLMYCGRIGSLTFAFSFARKKNLAPVQCPIGKITVG